MIEYENIFLCFLRIIQHVKGYYVIQSLDSQAI